MFSTTPLAAIEQGLNGSMAEQNAISQNIANIDTPGYKAKKVVFDDALQGELEANSTNPSHLPFLNSADPGFQTVTDNFGTIQNNGNNVDIDHEMSDLSRNQLLYQSLTQAASDQFLRFNTVLGGASG
ncbi:flagellar basal body rod protein FlgB [Sporolactobacillus shoreae]|uniref:Flagellar basal body rod protein FlgB n=1 Tax=Sporolactobacillus shoreae TaxID=1465501 RepID=A0A4Z0GU56_9BACL|nr:flagellar basal body rod protein FlgB [Sporolactobacillus shoreae]TGB00275.1 flagellar basal body rod protein FlgB [Sporolactobacillus shoreae]